MLNERLPISAVVRRGRRSKGFCARASQYFGSILFVSYSPYPGLHTAAKTDRDEQKT